MVQGRPRPPNLVLGDTSLAENSMPTGIAKSIALHCLSPSLPQNLSPQVIRKAREIEMQQRKLISRRDPTGPEDDSDSFDDDGRKSPSNTSALSETSAERTEATPAANQPDAACDGAGGDDADGTAIKRPRSASFSQPNNKRRVSQEGGRSLPSSPQQDPLAKSSSAEPPMCSQQSLPSMKRLTENLPPAIPLSQFMGMTPLPSGQGSGSAAQQPLSAFESPTQQQQKQPTTELGAQSAPAQSSVMLPQTSPTSESEQAQASSTTSQHTRAHSGTQGGLNFPKSMGIKRKVKLQPIDTSAAADVRIRQHPPYTADGPSVFPSYSQFKMPHSATTSGMPEASRPPSLSGASSHFAPPKMPIAPDFLLRNAQSIVGRPALPEEQKKAQFLQLCSDAWDLLRS